VAGGRTIPSVTASAFRERAGRTAAGCLFTCALSAAAIVALVGFSTLLHPARAAVGLNPASDFQVMTWSLAWWPFAIGHGLDPLHTHLLWPPEGFPTLWMTTIPVPSLLGLPLTLTAGPLVAYNVLMLLSVPLGAGAAYLLCRELTGRPMPSLVGGLLFGLSPYMLGHLLSQHLDLVFVFPVPLLALLAARRARGRIGGRRFVGLYALALVALLGTSFELFLDTALLTGLGVLLSLADRRRRRRALEVGAAIAAAYAVCAPLLLLVAVTALSASHGPLQYAPADYSIDLLNTVVPTATLLLGVPHAARVVVRTFVANIGEQDGYLGIPIMLVAALAVRHEWRRRRTVLAGLTLCALVLSFGPTLTVGGRPALALPFAIARLPLLERALPGRLSLFTALGAACLCALWLAEPGRSRLRLAVGVALVAAMLPDLVPPRHLQDAWARSDAFGWSTRHIAKGFLAQQGATHRSGGSNVLVLPTGAGTPAEYWQAEARMRFALSVPATPFVPPRVDGEPILRGLVEGVPPTLAAPRLRAFLVADRVRAVYVARSAGARWRRIVAAATSTSPAPSGGGLLFAVPTSLRLRTERSEPLSASSPPGSPALASSRRGGTRATAWLSFDGRRARLRVEVRRGGHALPVVTLSGQGGDADMVSSAVGRDGEVAIAFTDWRQGVDSMEVATSFGRRWRVATLDRRRQPIWSPRVVVAPGGEAFATWIDEDAPLRTVRAAVELTGRTWRRAVTLERADGLGSVSLVFAGGTGVAVWRDGIAAERRIRAATFRDGRWSHVVTLASSETTLDDLTIRARAPVGVAWSEEGSSERGARRFAARLHGATWVDVDRAG
jgi:hypothetical protein